MFIEQHWIFDEYRKVFRSYVPPIFVQEQMLDQITDRDAWKVTCFDWGMNDYKPSSVGKMLDYYRQRLAARKPVYEDLPPPKCSTCHDSKTATVPKTGRTFDWEVEVMSCPNCVEVANAA